MRSAFETRSDGSTSEHSTNSRYRWRPAGPSRWATVSVPFRPPPSSRLSSGRLVAARRARRRRATDADRYGYPGPLRSQRRDAPRPTSGVGTARRLRSRSLQPSSAQLVDLCIHSPVAPRTEIGNRTMRIFRSFGLIRRGKDDRQQKRSRTYSPGQVDVCTSTKTDKQTPIGNRCHRA